MTTSNLNLGNPAMMWFTRQDLAKFVSPHPHYTGNTDLKTQLYSYGFNVIRHENRDFRTAVFKPQKFDGTLLLMAFPAFSCGQTTFWKRSFSWTIAAQWSRDFPTPQLTNPKWLVTVSFSNSSRLVWAGPISVTATLLLDFSDRNQERII